MQQTHGSSIKGMSIAVIVLAGLAIFGIVIALLMVGVIGSAVEAAGPGSLDSAYRYGYTHGYDYAYSMDEIEAMLLISGIIGTLGILALIASAVVLVAGIIGVRGANNPARLGQVFGWSIAGAIASLLSGGIVTMVLLIIVAVFANKDKQYYQLAQQGAFTQQPQQSQQPQQFQQPPVQPAPQPVAQPVAQPAPQQPIQPSATQDQAAQSPLDQQPPTQPPVA